MAKNPAKNVPLIKIPQPFQVEIFTKPEQGKIPKWISKAILIGLIVLFLAAATGLMLLWFHQTEHFPFETPPLLVTISVDRPVLASLRDTFSITVILHNQTPESLNGSLLVRAEPPTIISLEESGATSVKVEDLPPGASLTRQMTFMPLETPPGKDLTLSVSLTTEGGQVLTDPARVSIRILGIPRLNTSLAWLFGAGGLTAVLTSLFWTQVKKAFS